jgi:SRSO17 transposase
MVQGLLSNLKRKSTEPIAVAFEGVDSVRNVTNFMSKSKWDNEGMLAEYRADLAETIAAEGGMITGDETGIPKKGNQSVGVARQYCGRTGKVDNCQVGVMVGYASSLGYGLVDCELYMPEPWFDEEHATRRKNCKVPRATVFQTKNEILSGMINRVVASGLFPAKYVGVDCAYGSDIHFLDSLPPELIYFADVRHNCHIFANRPSVSVPPYSGNGRKPIKEKPAFEPVTAMDAVKASELPWSKVVLGIGAKGPVIAEDIALQVVESRGGLPGKDIWLYARKLDNGDIKYALCNAPMDATIEDIRKPALMRWSIEQCFRECKDYLGMDHYESRSWIAWRRHMLFTLIAHLLITKLRIAFSITPDTPGVAPHIETPVDFDDYLEAFVQMMNGQEISNPNIQAIPLRPQQFLTIGLIQKLIWASFAKAGEVLKEINYALYKAMSAFTSHSTREMNHAIFASGCPWRDGVKN